MALSCLYDLFRMVAVKGVTGATEVVSIFEGIEQPFDFDFD